MLIHAGPVTSSTVVVAVDVGKPCVALSVTDTARRRLLDPIEFAMTAPALSEVMARISRVLPEAGVPVKIGVEAAGHYHRPILARHGRPGGKCSSSTRRMSPRHAESKDAGGSRPTRSTWTRSPSWS